MKMICEVPDEVIKCIKDGTWCGSSVAEKMIANGIPLSNPQKPICPSAGVDCEDCPAYEDTISRKAVIDTLENMDRALDEDRTVENYKDLLRECYKVLPSVKPRSEWEHDHEILKAYSDGASEVLDKVRAEIIELRSRQNVGVMECLDIIDNYKAEGSGE